VLVVGRVAGLAEAEDVIAGRVMQDLAERAFEDAN
jgi:hypothetical protein